MNCEEAVQLVEKLADGEASALEKSQAELHLGQCADCRSHYEFVLALSHASEKAPLPEPPAAYWDLLPSKVLARLDRQDRRGFWQKFFAPTALRWGAAAAMLVVVGAVSIMVVRDESVMDEMAQPASAPAEAPDPEAPRLARDEPSPSASETMVAEPAPSAPPRAQSLRRDSADTRSAEARQRAAPERALTEASQRANAAAVPAQTVEAEESLGAASALPSEPSPAAFEESVAGEGVVSDAEREYRALSVGESAGVAGRRSALQAEASPGNCDAWRSYLERHGDGPRGTDVRYELARCSIRLFGARPNEQAREAALGDADAFLAEESTGPRAEEIRAAVAPLRR